MSCETFHHYILTVCWGGDGCPKKWPKHETVSHLCYSCEGCGIPASNVWPEGWKDIGPDHARHMRMPVRNAMANCAPCGERLIRGMLSRPPGDYLRDHGERLAEQYGVK